MTINIDDIVLDGVPASESGRKMPPLTEEEKEILQHHGVLGMHWGHHTKRGNNLTVTSENGNRKKKTVDEAAREQQFKSEYANRDKMSTRQLQNRVKRLQAEQQFKELVNKPEDERKKAAQAQKEAKQKRNKFILKTALSIYGNVPIEQFVKDPKKRQSVKDIIGPSRALAKAASGTLKSSESLKTDEVLQQHGVPGMHWGKRRAVIRGGGKVAKQQVKLLEKKMKAAKQMNKAAKTNFKVSKQNYKANHNKLNKKAYKASKLMKKASKLQLKNTKVETRQRAQELIKKYSQQKVA